VEGVAKSGVLFGGFRLADLDAILARVPEESLVDQDTIFHSASLFFEFGSEESDDHSLSSGSDDEDEEEAEDDDDDNANGTGSSDDEYGEPLEPLDDNL
jgi:hypothetical protein